MRRQKNKLQLFLSIVATLTIIQSQASDQILEPVVSQEFIQQLKKTHLKNNDEILDQLHLKRNLWNRSPASFELADPYFPRTKKYPTSQDPKISQKGIKNYKKTIGSKVIFYHQPIVQNWVQLDRQVQNQERVCAFKLDQKTEVKKGGSLPERGYELKTFNSAQEAVDSGYTITHQSHCGACSSLKDLAVYLEKRNLTDESRLCSKKLILENSKSCFEKIGFTPVCAEAWAYSGLNTRSTCMNVCIQDYGIWNIIADHYPNESNDPDGTLRRCILCDEIKTGPGFKYSVGRNRRNSGIQTDIVRPSDQMYSIDYSALEKLFLSE
jgi:hypothetical protein